MIVPQAQDEWTYHDRETHASPDTRLLSILSQTCQYNWEERLEGGGSDTIEKSEDPQARHRVYRSPTVQNQPRHSSVGDHVVQWSSPSLSHVRWEQSSWDTNPVHYHQDVDARSLTCTEFTFCEAADEEEADINAPEVQEGANGIQRVRWLFECSPFDERARSPGR